MKFTAFSAALCAALTVGGAAMAQDDSAVTTNRFPLAAKKGVDSHADKTAPAGAVNSGTFNDKTWKYGHAWDAPANTPLWNPARIKLNATGKLTSASLPGNASPVSYCAAANSGVDFIWTEMQHSGGTWDGAQKMWTACPYAKAVPGARIPNTNEFDEQHALDLGALVLVVPTVSSEAEAKEVVHWAYFPPMGARSAGNMTNVYRDVPGGYRATINDNLVVITMIETLQGLQEVDKIAAVKGVSAIFAASSDLGNFSGYKQGDPDYERAINMVHDAALRAKKPLCGPIGWLTRPDFTCFQGPGGYMDANTPNLEMAYSDAAKKALGAEWNTQGKPTAGPFVPGYVPSRPRGAGGE